MATPILPQPAADADAVKRLAKCRKAELRAGHPGEAHLLDDDAPFYALAARSNAPEVTA